METTIKMVMLVLIMMTTGEAKEDLEGIVKEINERLTLAEEMLLKNHKDFMKTETELKNTQTELKKAKDELRSRDIQLEELLKMFKDALTATKEDLATTNDDLTATKADLTSTKDELTATKDDLTATKDDLNATKEDLNAIKDDLAAMDDELTATKDELTVAKDDMTDTKVDLVVKEHDLDRKVSFLRNPPFFHACGAHYTGITYTHKTIPYTNLLYFSTNTEGGDLDISSGVFICPYPGSYTVTWSMRATDDAGAQYVDIFLRKNEQKIEDSRHTSQYTGTTGRVYDQGGRTLVLHLNRGDTLDLYCEDCSANVGHLTFCVSLATFDIE